MCEQHPINSKRPAPTSGCTYCGSVSTHCILATIMYTTPMARDIVVTPN